MGTEKKQEVPLSGNMADPQYDVPKNDLQEVSDLLRRKTAAAEVKGNKGQERDSLAAASANLKAGPDAGSAFGKDAFDRAAAVPANDRLEAEKALAINVIEPDLEKELKQHDGDQEANRAASLLQASNAENGARRIEKSATDNTIESDEIFTASQADRKSVVPPEVEQQYLRVGDKFYHTKIRDLVAFEDKGNKLETASDSEGIAESMVRIAQARGWDEIKVSGSETFRREAWLEAAARGMHVKGYTPSEQDKAELAKRVPETKIAKENETVRARENDKSAETEKPQVKQHDRADSFAKDTQEDALKKYPELAGGYAALVSVDKQAEADGMSPQQRAIVAARVRQNAVNSIERGKIPELKIKEEIELKQERNAEREQSR